MAEIKNKEEWRAFLEDLKKDPDYKQTEINQDWYREWSIKLWCAETFGWTPQEVDNESWQDMENLMKIYKLKNRR